MHKVLFSRTVHFPVLGGGSGVVGAGVVGAAVVIGAGIVVGLVVVVVGLVVVVVGLVVVVVGSVVVVGLVVVDLDVSVVITSVVSADSCPSLLKGVDFVSTFNSGGTSKDDE